MTPLRKVPYPLPEDYEKYLGMPYSMIPCPDDCCEGFVEHFQGPFLEALEGFNISVEHYSGGQDVHGQPLQRLHKNLP